MGFGGVLPPGCLHPRGSPFLSLLLQASYTGADRCPYPKSICCDHLYGGHKLVLLTYWVAISFYCLLQLVTIDFHLKPLDLGMP